MFTSRQWLRLAGGVAIVVLIVVFCLPAATRWVSSRSLGLGINEQSGEGRYLGVVQEGSFRLLAPRPILVSRVRLTRMAMQVAQAPESAELDLKPYEGCCIVVQGRNSGGWFYSTKVIQVVGPLQTRLLRFAFDR